MKTVGIIGGIGPESTIEYYRFIIAGYRQRKGDASYPSIIINSVDLNRLVKWINADQLDPFTDYLVKAVEALATLARNGATFDSATVDTLRQKAVQGDENVYVRVKAAEALSSIHP